jgi:peptidoglycan/xylan/chitin deacetylase (PgdA/CDA1 family)
VNATARERLASFSVDLDEIPCYAAIHGLPLPSGRARHAIYDEALPRYLDFFDEAGIRATFFVVGADLERPENLARIRDAHARGHEIASHSHTHRYDLTRRDRAFVHEEIESSARILADATGARPAGFRAPGYTVDEVVFEALEASGYAYDSSVFPCPAYYVAKAAAMLAIRLRGRESRSILDHPRVLTAPADPYRVGARYHRRGDGMLELPVAVTRGLRLPFIGTFVVLGSERAARSLARGMVGRPHVCFETHGIDLACAERDDLAWLRPHQPDLRVSLETKRARLLAVVEELRSHGYRFVRLDEAAARF